MTSIQLMNQKHHQGTYFVLNGQITDDNFIVEKEGV